MSSKEKFFSISRAILATLWEAGEITIKGFFPHPYYHHFCHHRKKLSIHSKFYTLKKAGLIKKRGADTFSLTPRGQKEAFWSALDAKLVLHAPHRQKWDGYWRIIFFDIPEKKRRLRDDLRQILKTLGFKELQRSVWVTPYKIPELLNELLWEEKIKHYTRFITVKEIDYDRDLKKHFKFI